MAAAPRTLVIGATGMLGRHVARRLAAEGFAVRALTRDTRRARALLPAACEPVAGDVTDPSSLQAAMAGAEAVYVNLSPPRSPRRLDPEHRGTPLIARAARRAGVARLAKISFLGVPEAAGQWWQIRRKAESEQAVRGSGVPWTIFRPTWFMESLALFRIGRCLLVPALGGAPLHWIAGDDYARQVARALRSDAATGRMYVMQGPEPQTFRRAAERLARAWRPPALRRVPVPMAMLRALAALSADARYLYDLLRVTARTNTRFGAADAWADLGRPTMTIEDFAEAMRRTGDVPRK